jgi:hypothetical protein
VTDCQQQIEDGHLGQRQPFPRYALATLPKTFSSFNVIKKLKSSNITKQPHNRCYAKM